MRYDTVFTFTDDNQQCFSRFRLPRRILPNSEGDQVWVQQRQQQLTTNDDGTFLFDSENDPRSNVDNGLGGEGDETIYTRTEPIYWTCIKDGDTGCTIYPIPYTVGNEEFSVAQN